MNDGVAPPRSVGFFGVALLPVNGMIGAGIFALPATLVGAVGGFAPWQMLLGGFAFLPLVLTFAWLASHFDGSGGPVLYGKAAFGPFLGFQAGWARYAAGTVAVAANTHVMVSYFSALFPFLGQPLLHSVSVVLVIMGLTLLSILGMRQSVATLGFMTALKLLPLLALVLSAILGRYRAIPVVLPEFSQVESVLLLSFYAFIGFETAAMPAGEMREPRRDLPRALVAVLAAASTLTRLLTYVVSAAALPVIEHRRGAGSALHNAMALLAVALSCWIASHADTLSAVIFAALIGLGTLLYFVARRAARRGI